MVWRPSKILVFKMIKTCCDSVAHTREMFCIVNGREMRCVWRTKYACCDCNCAFVYLCVHVLCTTLKAQIYKYFINFCAIQYLIGNTDLSNHLTDNSGIHFKLCIWINFHIICIGIGYVDSVLCSGVPYIFNKKQINNVHNDLCN